MKLFGLQITKAYVPPLDVNNASALIPGEGTGGWRSLFGAIQESFPGAWQRNITVDRTENLLQFSPVFAGISLIAGDISKLRLKLTELDIAANVWREIREGATAFLPVIRKPNRFQTRSQFIACWIVSKLLYGNTYVLKSYDARGVVIALYILDASNVTPIVTDDGAVYYRLRRDPLSEVTQDDIVVRASDIIHDRMMCLWHPLVGVSPLYGAGRSATQGIKIQNNSETFFANMSRPSGILTAPQRISDATAERLKKHWETNYSASNIGKVAVLGDGITYIPMSIPAQQSQMVEQMAKTAEDVARVLHIPLHMLQIGSDPALASVGVMNQAYYSQALQGLINDLEDCYSEGLGLPSYRSVEFDLDDLMRLDPQARADASARALGAGYMSPDEARQRENLPPVDGGGTPYMQVQNYALSDLAKRSDAPENKLAPPPAPAPAPEPTPQPAAKALEDDPVVATMKLLARTRKALENA